LFSSLPAERTTPPSYPVARPVANARALPVSEAGRSVTDMVEITIEPASAERFGDVEHALTGGGDGGSCWCQWWMLPAKDWDASTRDERRELLRADLATSPASALVAG